MLKQNAQGTRFTVNTAQLSVNHKRPIISLISALEHHRYDVANLTVQTLVNTYPDSEYAKRAERLLEDPRIAPCGVSGNMEFLSGSSSICGESSNISTSPAELEFFPPPEPE